MITVKTKIEEKTYVSYEMCYTEQKDFHDLAIYFLMNMLVFCDQVSDGNKIFQRISSLKELHLIRTTIAFF